MSLEAIKFDKSDIKLSILDQLLIPYQTKYVDVKSIGDGYDVIKKMQVRGAPAIAIVGCFSVVVELYRIIELGELTSLRYNIQDLEELKERLTQRLDFLISSRPTAVNLLNGCNEIKELMVKASSVRELYNSIKEFSVKLFEDDLVNNKRIGDNGCDYIFNELSKENFKGEFSVLTICNTGSLATSGHGTALGIVRSLWARSKLSGAESSESWLSHVYACETRPYNQGSRLTAYELDYEKIPFSLITDNMVSFLVDSLVNERKDRGLPSLAPIKFIIVGADRIVKNGDLANKIGTFQLSLIASQYPSIKFIGAAPWTTIDLNKDSGDEIVIEQRPANELTSVMGGELDETGTVLQKDASSKIKLTKVKLAPMDISVWNPAFDVTPHKFIDSIVTEESYLTKDSQGSFTLAR
ncbi:unnamed protein product [Kuraishia capsulata CBS 1993]|uniref:Methylthioribose-1-phosphate isomerase n=1 Tax=Kuraishia capsulata CBS 1993 TaxID=1382522 RepID=W6MXA9_9ASCO|nr:uncharacterized protein KUCA_T00004553001 [Kuraishia capsulata CBS 1993]CDK28570.1 unnamed protein product [Kuraishia capsulata CBS 1993]